MRAIDGIQNTVSQAIQHGDWLAEGSGSHNLTKVMKMTWVIHFKTTGGGGWCWSCSRRTRSVCSSFCNCGGWSYTRGTALAPEINVENYKVLPSFTQLKVHIKFQLLSELFLPRTLCFCLRISVCLLVTLRKKYKIVIQEIFLEGWCGPRKKLWKIWGDPDICLDAKTSQS